MEENPKLLWENCLKIIRDNVSEQQFKTWFGKTRFCSFNKEEKKLVILVPSPFFYEYLEEHFLDLLRSSITKVFGEGAKLSYRILEDKEHKLTVDMPTTDHTTSVKPRAIVDANKVPNPMQTVKSQDLDPHLNARYNFSNFIEGYSNKLSRTVGLNVAQHPANTAFNPLFIYGASGVGKTHLVNAIGTQIKELYPEKRVLYVSAHLFYVQYADASRKNRVPDFIRFYQNIDVLIIDDIQEISGYEKTQNTFFHIFNSLHQNGKQIIMTSDRSPAQMVGVADRLLTRFKWGMLAEMERPNTELRRDILKSKIANNGLSFPEPVIDFIAENVNESVRDLEGTITSMMAFSNVFNRDIDLPLAEMVIKKVTKVEKKPVTIENIIEKVCAFYKVEKDSIFTSSRKKSIAQARQVAMYLAQKHTSLASSRIGKLVGNRDHATVIHSVKKITSMLEVDQTLKSELQAIEDEIRKQIG